MNLAVAVLLFQAIAAVPAAPETRPLVLRVRDSSKVPVRGARIVVEPAVPAEMALAGLLAKRAGASKDDGLLDLGLVPSKDPLTLRIGAPGHRMAWLKLPAGFEAGRRDVVLPANQDVEVRVAGLAQRRGEARAEVTLARCRNQFARSNCNPGESWRRRLDEDGRATFARMDGGSYAAQVSVPGVGVTREIVEVARDGDAPTVLVAMAVGEWTFRGTTRLQDGTAVVARVSAMEFVKGVGEGTAAETRSAADGSFEVRVVSQAENKILLKAESDDPRAVSSAITPMPLDASRTVVEDVLVELDATALEIVVSDAGSGARLPGCPVQFDWEKTGESSYRGSQRTTDADGVAREIALSGGAVRVRVSCKDHYTQDLGVVAVARAETKRVEVALSPAKDLVLTAMDENGRGVAGASVFASEAPASAWASSALTRGDRLAGLTDDAGQLPLKGQTYGGRLVFVVAAGRTLGMGVLPVPESCDRPEDCRFVVSVCVPRPSAGVLVRRESGNPVAPQDVLLRRGGLPIPWPILTAVLYSNGLFVDEPASLLELRVASFLPDGLYTATVQRPRITPETRRDVKWTEVPIGSFSIPSLGRVELVDRDGVSPKPADAVAPRVAER